MFWDDGFIEMLLVFLLMVIWNGYGFLLDNRMVEASLGILR